MPPRSYYLEPRSEDYLAMALAFFPEEHHLAAAFINRTELPYIRNFNHLAAYLGVSPKLIRQILHSPDFHYRDFPIPKKDGSTRQVSTPRTYLKTIQWWICDNILDQTQLNNSVHGFRRGRSFITNAKIHFGKRHLLNVDIERFFPNISRQEVADVFIRLGYDVEASALLSGLTTLRDAAPTGAPTSPMLGNLVLAEFDAQLNEYANLHGLCYSRYADDITLSSDNWIDFQILDDVSLMVEQAGFSLNTKKSKFMGPGDRREVTGVVIGSKLTMPRSWRNAVRGYLHKTSKAPSAYVDELSRINGILGTLLSFDPEAKEPLTRLATKSAALVSSAKALA